jgi:hypothetical protein
VDRKKGDSGGNTHVFLLSLMTAVLGVTSVVSSDVNAHEVGAPFSSAIIDPVVTHHAHIENEQRLNFSSFRRFRDDRGDYRSVFMHSFEVAWSPNYRWGVEAQIPFSDQGHGRTYGIGDIEVWPLKYSFLSAPDRVLTGVIGFTVPSGSTARGLGDGHLVLEPHLFFDRAVRNWFLGLNLAPSVNLTGTAGAELEYNGVVAYSFIRGTERLAPPVPRQAFVISTFCEFLAESGVSGAEAGEHAFALLPGFSIWHVGSGWIGRLGVRVPLSQTRDSDATFYLQIGNHVSWGDLAQSVVGKRPW